MTTKKFNSKSTKAEIIEAFNELEQEKKALEAEIKQLSKNQTVTIQPVETPKAPSITQPEKLSIVTSQTMSKSINQTIENLEQLQVGFGSAVSNLSEQLIAEASKLEKLQESVTAEVQQLQELHDLEVIAEDTLENLITDYEENSKTFTEELNQRKETLEQEIQALNQAWFKEKETHNREIKERNLTNQKNRQRDEEEYTYNLNLERSLNEQEYEQQKRALYKELEEIKKAQEKQWQEREETIIKQETEYREVKEKVEAFEKELEAKIKQGKEEGKGIGNYQAKVKADLRTKEIEGERRNYELRTQSLEQSIQNQETRIQSLSKQLEAALKQVQDLAVKAIEGTSNRNSYDAMREIALEQAKNQPKNK